MTKLKFLAAAAALSTLTAAPALAKDVQSTASKQSVKVQKMNKQVRAPSWRNDRAADVQYDRNFDNRGFSPEPVAGLVGGAVNTAGAIATAPFRDDYAYDNAYDNSYAYSPATTYDDDTFVPGAVATDIVGGAVNTAGAIATAPFRDTYAYDNAYSAAPAYRSTYNAGNDSVFSAGWDGDWNRNWARRQSVEQGGFICTPGTSYTNSYGYTQLCQ